MINRLDFLSEFKNRRILVAPLNWGLGHVTRCVPIIDRLNIQNDIILASDGVAYQWLKNQYPDTPIIELPSYNPVYDQYYMWLNMLKMLPTFMRSYNAEQKLTEEIVQKYEIDLILSDHRLGVRLGSVHSIIMAHQLAIPHSNVLISKSATMLHKKLIDPFDQCWVPDTGDHYLSGKMSQLNLIIPTRFIGLLSRLQQNNLAINKYDVAVVLSGPEPERSNLEEALMTILTDQRHLEIAFVRGTEKKKDKYDNSSHIQSFDLVDSSTLNDILNESANVICRSGYSSLMDLECLQKNAILIPTPRHPEQEYLAHRHRQRDRYSVFTESSLNSESLLSAIRYSTGSSK